MTPLEELLRQEIAQLKKSNAALVAENAKIKGDDLIEDERRALAFIDPLVPPDQYVHADAVAEALKIEIARANWILGRLTQSKHIFETPDIPHRYRIEQKGRDAVHNPSV